MAKLNMIFHDFLKFVQIIIKGHPRYVDMFWGLGEAISVSWSHFLSISGHMVGHIVGSQKYVKIAKIAILARNSIFDTAADIGQNDDHGASHVAKW